MGHYLKTNTKKINQSLRERFGPVVVIEEIIND